MAITTLKLWMAPESNRLLAGPSSFSPAQNPVFYEGNTARIELHILAGAGIGKIPYEVAFPAGASIQLAVGQVNAFPTSGSWKLMVEDNQTADMPFNATPVQVAAALNALASVQAAGGVTSALNGDGYTVTWNTLGTKPDIGIGADTLVPSSYESISLVQQGTATNRKVIYVELRQAPVALGVEWDPLPSPVISVSEVTAWNGTTQTWRFSIEPAPKAGSYDLTVAGTLTKSYNLSYSATADNITNNLATDFPNSKAYKTGEAQFDIVFQEQVILTADGNGLIGYIGYIGNVNFSTAEIHQLIGGLASRQTTLEVAIESDGIPQTLIQVNCIVSSDVISNGVLQPLPLGTAMSEQVANARFVRRDVDQNPDSITQDMIWQNLGVDTLGSDVVGALNLADYPSAANPFATISDLSGLGATWGNITGTLSDQTDLQLALDNKYDASNPSNFIQEANVDGNLYGRMNGMWEVVPSLTGYATESWVTSQGYLGSTGGTVTDGNIYLQNSTSTNYAYLNEGSVFFSKTHDVSGEGCQYGVAGVRIWNDQLQEGGFSVYGLKFFDGTTQTTAATSFDPTGYATESWVQSQGYLTSVPPPSLTGLTGDISWDAVTNTGRLLIEGGNSPDGISFSARLNFGSFTPNQPANGDFWRVSNKFQYFISGEFGGVFNVASEYYVNSYVFSELQIFSQQIEAAYAKKSGATFTGKVNMAAPTAGSASLNLGVGTAPTTSVAGDIWIATNINFRDSVGTLKAVANTNTTNTFTQPQIIGNSGASAALRITQLGTGNAIEVEDSTTPDATRFVVDQFGKVGVGTAPDATAAIKVDANGISFNGLVFNPTATAAHTGGSDTLDLLVTINGVNYRLGLRPA